MSILNGLSRMLCLGKCLGFLIQSSFLFGIFILNKILLRLQLISNDIFKSVEHRVMANRRGPRVSVASFFSTGVRPSTKLFGPIKELLSEDNPPKYRETTLRDFNVYYREKGLNGKSALSHFKL